MIKDNIGRKAFVSFNSIFLALVALSCLFPFIHVLSVSLSAPVAANSGEVSILPVGFSLKAYEFVLQKSEFIKALGVSFERILLGTPVYMLIIILVAYPLSKEVRDFRFRTVYAWFFVFTMFFGGGLIPWYIVIMKAGLLDSIWALILPGAVQVFSITILLNFFRELPKELIESAFLDGAGHWRVLFSIYLPISIPPLATLTLFTVVTHWNSWFDGLILMNSTDKYPLQTYMQTILIQVNPQFLASTNPEVLKNISEVTIKTAQIVIGALPVLILYPFLQKYFMKGIILGSVKE